MSVGQYKRRLRRDAVVVASSIAATVAALALLALIVGELLCRGGAGLSLRLVTTMTPPPGGDGGLLNAIVGSLLITALAVVIGTPLGVLAGTYLAEYGRHGRLAPIVRFVNDSLLSAPSIVLGLFVYEIAVRPFGRFSGYAGAIALTLILVPVVVGATDDMLALVPKELSEAALSLGLRRATVIARMTYRAAWAGILTGLLLAVARIGGETAPLLFTALNNQFFSLDMSHAMASLPAAIFQFALSPYPEWRQLAWSAALLITLTVLALTIAARSLTTPRTPR